MRDWVIFAAVCLTSAALLVSEAHASGVNYRGPFEGRVVDQDTGQPIEGAVVFVRWDLQRFTSPVFFDAKEVLTDRDGKFLIPANWSFIPWRNLFLDSSVIIFKAGYGYVSVHWNPILQTAEILKSLSVTDREKPRAGCDRAVGDVEIFLHCIPVSERSKGGPGAYFSVRFDGDVPVFLLKKLSTKEEYGNNTPLFGSAVPPEKRKLLMEEMNREEDVFRNEREHRK